MVSFGETDLACLLGIPLNLLASFNNEHGFSLVLLGLIKKVYEYQAWKVMLHIITLHYYTFTIYMSFYTMQSQGGTYANVSAMP